MRSIEKKVSTRVFFAASMPKSANQRKKYQSILDELKKLGCKITYDWLNDKKDYDPRITTEKATAAIKLANLLVAENTDSSTGVGGQIVLAQLNKIPVVILNEVKSTENSQFFNFSSVGSGASVYKYDKGSLSDVLTLALKNVTKERFVKFNFISNPEITQALETASKRAGISMSEHLRRILSQHFKL